MADSRQYLRFTFAGQNFLLPSTAGFTIEQRENMQVNTNRNLKVAAWRVTRTARWPAYALDGNFRVTHRDDWQRAVFVEAMPHPIGVVVDDVYLLPRAQVQASPFTPLGPEMTEAGHLFSATWISESEVMLVMNANAMFAYLQGLGN